MDGAADAGDDQQHQQAERVQAQTEVHLQITDFEPGRKGFLFERFPAVCRDEDHAQSEAGDNRADRKLCAQVAIFEREERDCRRREQRQKQDEPG